MSELLIAIGLVLFIEGAAYALAPNAMKRALEQMIMTPDSTLRLAGAVLAALGVGIVWLVKG